MTASGNDNDTGAPEGGEGGDGGEDGLAGAAIGAAARAAAGIAAEEVEERAARNTFSKGPTGVGVGILLFALGLFCGVPIAMLGFDTIARSAAGLFGFLLGLIGTAVAILILLLIFRRPIWQSLYKKGEVEVEKLATPLASMAKNAAAQKMDDAMDSARDFAEMVLARYAWLTTRRWLVGSIAGLLASVAALAGSTLLFQQNRLLANQSVLLQEQTGRLTEQNNLLETQIALAEAERSALIGPEILRLAAEINEEAAALVAKNGPDTFNFVTDLSPGLRGRIVALSNIARPYRYLMPGEVDPRDGQAVLQKALARRPDILNAQGKAQFPQTPSDKAVRLVDNERSPERGQILTILFNARLFDTDVLNFMGADWSFAEFRQRTFGMMSFRHAFMSYAAFPGMQLRNLDFGAATLDFSNFHQSTLQDVDFGGILSTDIKPPFVTAPNLPVVTSSLTGTDFTGAVLSRVQMDRVTALVADFSEAALFDVDFSHSQMGGSIFAGAYLYEVNFTDASLQSIDLEGALVTDADFITQLAAQAEPDSFVPERWQLLEVPVEKLQAHPRYVQLANFLPDEQLPQHLYRVEKRALPVPGSNPSSARD